MGCQEPTRAVELFWLFLKQTKRPLNWELLLPPAIAACDLIRRAIRMESSNLPLRLGFCLYNFLCSFEIRRDFITNADFSFSRQTLHIDRFLQSQYSRLPSFTPPILLNMIIFHHWDIKVFFTTSLRFWTNVVYMYIQKPQVFKQLAKSAILHQFQNWVWKSLHTLNGWYLGIFSRIFLS